MRVLLVGPASERARLRAQLDRSIEIAGEFASLAEARAVELDVDALLVAPVRNRSPAPEDDVEPLTSREIQVLTLLAEGLPNKEIANRLGLKATAVERSGWPGRAG